MSRCIAAFEIDDSTITERGFTYRSTYPVKFTGNSFILTSMDTLCVKVYSNNQTGHCFAVGFGQFLGKNWIHIESDAPLARGSSWKEYAQEEYDKMLARAPEHAQYMDKMRSGDRVCIMQAHLRQLTQHTYVVWKSPRENVIKLEVFRDLSFGNAVAEWMGPDVDVGGIFPVLAQYFRISIDITIDRKYMISTVTGGPS